MPQRLLAIKPVTPSRDAFLLIDNGQGRLSPYGLSKDGAITISVLSKDKKYCQGWYDITTHQNFPCKNAATVDAKFDSCFACRSKTNFNPGFYNSKSISSKQKEYNAQPHSVYVAYFGCELYKAGILSQSRGLDRIFEQGAIYYAMIEHVKDASSAHALEERLIRKGLRNSVTKSQKQMSLESLHKMDDKSSRQMLKNKLISLGLADNLPIHTTLDIFFFGHRPTEIITTVKGAYISGSICGIVGNYLVVENHDRLFGIWLSKLLGYEVEISQKVEKIEAEPVQNSLF